jgi:hypothetical protein
MFRAFLAHHQDILYCLVSRSLWQNVIQSIIYRYLHWVGKPELVAVLLQYLCIIVILFKKINNVATQQLIPGYQPSVNIYI